MHNKPERNGRTPQRVQSTGMGGLPRRLGRLQMQRRSAGRYHKELGLLVPVIFGAVFGDLRLTYVSVAALEVGAIMYIASLVLLAVSL
jgi:hypothetical protein